MPPVVNLQADNLTVEPGQTTTGELSLANTGQIVEQFTILLLGDVAPWTEADPPVVSLFPGGQQTVTLRFSPPRHYSTPAGEVPFAVKVIPSNEPEESVTEEGTITVGSFSDIGAELVPRVATARIAGHQKLAVDSHGNVPLPVGIVAVDAADALKFDIRPNRLTTAPGEARFVKVKVKPRQRHWKGPNQQKPYKVTVTPEDDKPPVVLDGALTQKAVLPKWLYALVGAAAVLVLLYFVVLRPAVKNDAQNADRAALAAQAAKTQSLSSQVSAVKSSVAANSAQVAANSAQVAALTGKKPTTTTSSSTTTTTTIPKKVQAATVATTTTTTQPAPVTGPNDGRVEVVAAPGSTSTNSVTIPSHSTLEITNLVIQNVAGGVGRAGIERLPAGTGQTPEVLLEENLGTLTDQEYTFNTPIVFTSGQQLILSVDCGADQAACDVGIYYTGPMTEPAADTTTTFP